MNPEDLIVTKPVTTDIQGNIIGRNLVDTHKTVLKIIDYLCEKHNSNIQGTYQPPIGSTGDVNSQTNTTNTVSFKGGVPARCGCTMTYPHSHLVTGHECDCEKGVPENPKTPVKEPTEKEEKHCKECDSADQFKPCYSRGCPCHQKKGNNKPTSKDLTSPEFEAAWNAIKGWDIERNPGAGYAGATGTDVWRL